MIIRIKNSFIDKLYKLQVLIHNTLIFSSKKMLFNNWLKNNKAQNNYLTHYSSLNRFVQIEAWEKEQKELIVTCYFVNKKDPQYGNILTKPNIDYIKPWYNSMVKLNLGGIILHDGIDEDFIKLHETEKIKFRYFQYGNYSIFEERWFAYYFLMSNLNLKKVFFTDVNDVFITKDPFKTHSNNELLYVGRDHVNKTRHSNWLEVELNHFKNDANFKVPFYYKFQSVYNAGVVGGNINITKALAAEIINLTLKTQTDKHKDMSLLNLSICRRFPILLNYSASEKSTIINENFENPLNGNVYSGYPLNSLFKSFNFTSDATFIHK